MADFLFYMILWLPVENRLMVGKDKAETPIREALSLF